MNTLVIIIAAIVCITAMVIIANIFAKKIDGLSKIFLERMDEMTEFYKATNVARMEKLGSSCNAIISNIGTAADFLGSKIEESSNNAVEKVQEIIDRIETLEKKDFKVQFMLGQPVETLMEEAKRDLEKEMEKETEDRKTYNRVKELREKGKSLRSIADELGYKSTKSIYRILEKGNKNNW